MWFVILIAIAALAAGAGDMTKGGGGGETPVASWVLNGIKFTWSGATEELIAYHTQAASGAEVVELVGKYATQDAAYAASMAWLPAAPTPGAPAGPIVEPPPEWVDHGIKFSWSPTSKELLAYHTQQLGGGVGPEVVELVGEYPTQGAAYAASLGWVPFGEGAGAPDPDAPIVCQTIKTDGKFQICLYTQPGGKWGFRATDGGLTVATGGAFATKLEAVVGAWQMLVPFSTDVVPAPDTRHGVTLHPDGSVMLDAKAANIAAFKAHAIPVWQAELDKGESDPAGLILAVLGSIWPAVNLLRLRPYGQSLGEVAARVSPVKDDAAAAVGKIFVVQGGLATNPNPTPPAPQASSGPAVQIELGPSAELLQHTKADGSQWWIVTEAGQTLTGGGTEIQPWATWGVWGPDAPVAGDPAGAGSTGLRDNAIAAAKVWIEGH